MVVGIVAVAVALPGCGSGTSTSDAPSTRRPERATTVDARDARGLAERLLPAPPTPTAARKVQRGCDAAGMPGMGDHVEGEEFTSKTAPDGRFERVFGGMNPRVEVSEFPFDAVATEAQGRAADTFVARVREVVKERGWEDPANVIRDGYRPMQQCNSHLINVDAVLDGRDLDPEHPEFLVVEPGGDGRTRFHSVMFMASSNEGHGPQPFGPLAVWHYHTTAQCMIDGLILVPQTGGGCAPGTKRYERTPEMLHVTMSGFPFDPGM